MGYLLWAVIAYKLLPDHEVATIEESAQKVDNATTVTLPEWKERITVGAFAVSVVGMMLMNVLGNIAYIVPALAASVLVVIDVLDFKEVRDNMTSPVVLMTAGVIGVADALSNSGFTAMIGDSLANMVGSDINPFFIILIFAFLTSASATFTGSNMGSVFIFAPIAIASCISLGLNPTAAAVAVVTSGWNGGFMPIDGMPAMIFGMGNYKLPEFWKYTVPMYIIRIVFLVAGAMLVFPV